MPSFRYVVADVFTDRPLEGNQLAVFTDAREIPEHRLQALAKELALSETVFVYPPEAEGHARLRIFTPATELPFAGHPVLGTAFVLGAPMQLPGDLARAEERYRPDHARARRGGPARLRPDEPADPDDRALSRRPTSCSRCSGSRRTRRSSSTTTASGTSWSSSGARQEVSGLAPDFAALKRLGGSGSTASPARARSGRRACSGRRSAIGRGSGDGLGGRADRLSSRASRADRLRRRDRAHPGRRDRAALHALREGGGIAGVDRARRGRRLRRASSRAGSFACRHDASASTSPRPTSPGCSGARRRT